MKEDGYEVVYTSIIPDDLEVITAELRKCADELKAALVLTTGGSGFSPRDNTPEATKAVIEKEVPGIPELMRAESCKITDRGCLSRSVAGIRGGTLIINLPGSLKAARENFDAVRSPLLHGMDMLASAGSADCGEEHHHHDHHHGQDHCHHHDHHHHGQEHDRHCDHLHDGHCDRSGQGGLDENKEVPCINEWMKSAKEAVSAFENGMYLLHNGVVRETARSRVREGDEEAPEVKGMKFSYDKEKVEAAIENAKQMEGITYIRVWLNTGELTLGDDIMYVLVGGDIRPHVIDALQALVGEIKNHCVEEKEVY